MTEKLSSESDHDSTVRRSDAFEAAVQWIQDRILAHEFSIFEAFFRSSSSDDARVEEAEAALQWYCEHGNASGAHVYFVMRLLIENCAQAKRTSDPSFWTTNFDRIPESMLAMRQAFWDLAPSFARSRLNVDADTHILKDHAVDWEMVRESLDRLSDEQRDTVRWIQDRFHARDFLAVDGMFRESHGRKTKEAAAALQWCCEHGNLGSGPVAYYALDILLRNCAPEARVPCFWVANFNLIPSSMIGMRQALWDMAPPSVWTTHKVDDTLIIKGHAAPGYDVMKAAML